MNRWIHALALQARKQVAQALGMTRKNKPGRLAPGARSRGFMPRRCYRARPPRSVSQPKSFANCIYA